MSFSCLKKRSFARVRQIRHQSIAAQRGMYSTSYPPHQKPTIINMSGKDLKKSKKRSRKRSTTRSTLVHPVIPLFIKRIPVAYPHKMSKHLKVINSCMQTRCLSQILLFSLKMHALDRPYVRIDFYLVVVMTQLYVVRRKSLALMVIWEWSCCAYEGGKTWESPLHRQDSRSAT